MTLTSQEIADAIDAEIYQEQDGFDTDGYARFKIMGVPAAAARVFGLLPTQAQSTMTEEERDVVESAQYHAEKNPSAWWSETFFELIGIIDRLQSQAPGERWRDIATVTNHGTPVWFGRIGEVMGPMADNLLTVDELQAEGWTHWRSLDEPAPPSTGGEQA